MSSTLRLLVLSSVVALAGCGRNDSVAPTATDDAPAARDNSVTPPASKSANLLVQPESSRQELSDPKQFLSEDQLRNGWISLFDGQTLFGWVANSDAAWSVRDGEIICGNGSPGLLLTTTRFQDYELMCDVWLEPGGNSGLFLRTVSHPSNPAKDCLEFNLCDGHDSFPTGSLVARKKAATSPTIEGAWHQVKLVLDGERFAAEIDGQSVLETTSPDLTKTTGGHIALQQNGGEVRFRNIFLRPLNLQPLLDDPSLSGWQDAPGSKADITVNDGEVNVRGAGYLESRSTYDDFILQFETRLNMPDVNSGLFFRAEPATETSPSNGYELQLQNTIAGNDRRRPADYGEGFGTGAIFRRQKARYVNADDQTWFNVTLVVDKNHFSSWINGLQVTDFLDEREPDSNPRRGRRDEAGHLSLQGHDNGTDASFRNIRLVELPLESSPVMTPRK